MANRGRQASLCETGLGVSIRGPIFDHSLTVSSVMSLEAEDNLPPVGKLSHPKKLRHLKASSLAQDNAECNEMELMKQFPDKDEGSAEVANLSVGSRTGKLLGHSGNLSNQERRQRLKRGGCWKLREFARVRNTPYSRVQKVNWMPVLQIGF